MAIRVSLARPTLHARADDERRVAGGVRRRRPVARGPQVPSGGPAGGRVLGAACPAEGGVCAARNIPLPGPRFVRRALRLSALHLFAPTRWMNRATAIAACAAVSRASTRNSSIRPTTYDTTWVIFWHAARTIANSLCTRRYVHVGSPPILRAVCVYACGRRAALLLSGLTPRCGAGLCMGEEYGGARQICFRV